MYNEVSMPSASSAAGYSDGGYFGTVYNVGHMMSCEEVVDPFDQSVGDILSPKVSD